MLRPRQRKSNGIARPNGGNLRGLWKTTRPIPYVSWRYSLTRSATARLPPLDPTPELALGQFGDSQSHQWFLTAWGSCATVGG